MASIRLLMKGPNNTSMFGKHVYSKVSSRLGFVSKTAMCTKKKCHEHISIFDFDPRTSIVNINYSKFEARSRVLETLTWSINALSSMPACLTLQFLYTRALSSLSILLSVSQVEAPANFQIPIHGGSRFRVLTSQLATKLLGKIFCLEDRFGKQCWRVCHATKTIIASCLAFKGGQTSSYAARSATAFNGYQIRHRMDRWTHQRRYIRIGPMSLTTRALIAAMFFEICFSSTHDMRRISYIEKIWDAIWGGLCPKNALWSYMAIRQSAELLALTQHVPGQNQKYCH